MRQVFFSILAAILLLASCAEKPTGQGSTEPPLPPAFTQQPATLAPIPTPTRSTSTSQPVTAAKSPTPTYFLPHNRPLIAYESSGASNKQLNLVDPSEGRSLEYAFPAGALFATPFLAGLSPDARYFVYYQGGKEDVYGNLQAEPPDFVMHVLDLNSRQVIFSAPLLSPEFPADLKPMVESTEDEFWRVETDRQTKLQAMLDTMQATVLNYLRTVAWSPDASRLAFASQNPGPSSDMYFFDPASLAAWGVSSEPGHVLRLTWAPDSSAIALETTLYDRHMRRVTTEVLARTGAALGSVEYTYFHGWLNPTTILLRREIDFGDPFFSLEGMSIAQPDRLPLWEASFDDFAVPPDLSSVLISSSQPNNPGETPGLFLKDIVAGTSLTLSASQFWKVAYWGSEHYEYAASAPDEGIFDAPQTGGTYGISKTGELFLIDEGNWNLLPSPDGRFLAAYGPYDTGPGLRVFGEDGGLLGKLSDSKITCLQWEATADSLAYQVGDRLYLWETGDETARQIAGGIEDELRYGACGFSWVNQSP